jgi:hypothetical protein
VGVADPDPFGSGLVWSDPVSDPGPNSYLHNWPATLLYQKFAIILFFYNINYGVASVASCHNKYGNIICWNI